MRMQLAVLCLLGVIMTATATYSDSCFLNRCGSNLGVYYLILTRPGRPSFSAQVVTFHSDGFVNGIASNQATEFSGFEGTWRCNDRNNIEVTDFLFNYAVGSSPATLSKGVFNLALQANGNVTGTLGATVFNLDSTQNSDQSTWTQVFQINFDVKGYELLDRCRN